MNPLRSIILAMAGSAFWRRMLTRRHVTRRVVARFIPGESLDEALQAVRRINRDGLRASLNPLGEDVGSLGQATAATDVYIDVLERIADAGLDCNVSVKLTMLGLDLGEQFALANLRRIVAVARSHGNSVRIDMESSARVDPTLAIWKQLRSEGHAVGIVVQSYLRRTREDLEELVAAGASLRVVKGAYAEPESVAFPDKSDVDRSYREILERLALPDAQQTGVRVAVASHDAALLEHARRLIDDRQLRGWEFQMLFGIGKPLQQRLARGGYPVRIYVSYGCSWYPWFMRRLAERPANLLFFLRHLFG